MEYFCIYIVVAVLIGLIYLVAFHMTYFEKYITGIAYPAFAIITVSVFWPIVVVAYPFFLLYESGKGRRE